MRDLKGATVDGGGGRWLRLRVRLVAVVFCGLFFAAFVRAVNLQVFERKKLSELAQDQYIRQIEVPSRRGEIFDRRGTQLAQSVPIDSIWVDPSMLSDTRRASRELAKRLHIDPDELFARLARARRFAWVKRQAKPDEVEAVKALAWPALGFTKEPQRFYPQRELAAQVVGMVGTEGKGLEGIELAFDDELTGENGSVFGLRDAKGRKLIFGAGASAVDRQGASLTLTLDRHLQYLAEKALGKAVQDARGIAGMAVILDPRTGELLGLANYPTFNPNNPLDSTKGAVRNRAALDAFEPGSTFKSFLVAAALEERAIKSDDIFFCENGAWPVGRKIVNDTHPYGWLSPGRVLQVSSNICVGKIAQILGRDRMVHYYGRFGFGERSGLALPGEGRGVVPFPQAEISLVNESFGQGLTATAVQLAAAYGALANDGLLMRPYLVSKVMDPDGVVLLDNRPTPVRQVVSAKTAHTVISMLESVVEKEGTAPKARLDEYRVAGKTGTAQKADPVVRGYSDKRVGSFIGVVPAERPRLVILVVIDEPKTDVYGGLVAAPAFKEIAREAMPYLGVPPSHGAAVAVSPPVPNPAVPVRGGVAGLGQGGRPPDRAISVVTEPPGEGSVQVPDLTGQAGREAVVTLLTASLEPKLSGSGRVVSQTPAPGARVERGSRVTLEMATRQ
ncbi:MAG: penicillin-binding protein [Myxococcaceae bacterium]